METGRTWSEPDVTFMLETIDRVGGPDTVTRLQREAPEGRPPTYDDVLAAFHKALKRNHPSHGLDQAMTNGNAARGGSRASFEEAERESFRQQPHEVNPFLFSRLAPLLLPRALADTSGICSPPPSRAQVIVLSSDSEADAAVSEQLFDGGGKAEVSSQPATVEVVQISSGSESEGSLYPSREGSETSLSTRDDGDADDDDEEDYRNSQESTSQSFEKRGNSPAAFSEEGPRDVDEEDEEVHSVSTPTASGGGHGAREEWEARTRENGESGPSAPTAWPGEYKHPSSPFSLPASRKQAKRSRSATPSADDEDEAALARSRKAKGKAAVVYNPMTSAREDILKTSKEFKEADEEEWRRRNEVIRQASLKARQDRERKRESNMRIEKRLVVLKAQRAAAEKEIQEADTIRPAVRNQLYRTIQGSTYFPTVVRRLGIAKDLGSDPSMAVITKIYRKSILQYHPDRAARTSNVKEKVYNEEVFKILQTTYQSYK